MRALALLAATVVVTACTGSNPADKSASPTTSTQRSSRVSNSAPTTSGSLTTASALSSTSASSSAAAAPTASIDPTADEVKVLADKAGAAGVGFVLRGLADGGWSRSATGPSLIHLSGPPGGPLQFEIRAYDAEAGKKTFAQTFDAWLSLKPFVEGVAEKVKIAGADREAQSFRTGQSRATTCWCLVKLPKEGAATGLFALFGSGCDEKKAPTCAEAMNAPSLKPIAATLALVP